MMDHIDIVITWVDGSDPAWRRKRAYWQNYEPQEGSVLRTGDVEGRYRDTGELKYLLRSIESYWPGKPNIFLVTDNQIPAWIRSDHPQLHIVDHQDYIPEQYLPLFSSQAIECQLHHIAGLSDTFVYFNDDVFLARPPEWDLMAGLNGPVFPVAEIMEENSGPEMFSDQLSVTYCCRWIQKVFKIQQEPWLPAHAPRMLNKDWLNQLEETFPELFQAVLSQRFRSEQGINITGELYYRWHLAEGRGEVRDVPVLYIESCADNAQALYEQGLSNPEQWPYITINDTGDNRTDIGQETLAMIEFLEAGFPEPSSFEI
ncbi:Stealth CR1 domain-containing protein [Sansalvadorimonas sp. 2012CJ34-2]|uniref:Stealth CR1 domain-containing protein n=1 Tax=Parendozoicomonas callyspongiae TaxID=2942213 RepID=A0ABT0PI92_9GAMM|nr:Stealth CR1 domain-containing protein [Sansalvadorimonas sp. 2012CJ34-2]MCL6271064.1 Stealth CR1 domain-containing protein [Sansalvadorimonas sp. 2012CJ34-2]